MAAKCASSACHSGELVIRPMLRSSLARAESPDQIARIEGLPRLIGPLLHELPVHPNQRERELAADRSRSEDPRQLRQVYQPVRVPRGPVRVHAVDDPEHEVMRLRCYVKYLA